MRAARGGMPRKPRQEVADGIHHVWARGNNRERTFFGEEDCRLYLFFLARVVVKRGWRLLSFCLMHNHIHLLVETPEPNLGRGMQHLHGLYAQTLNERRGRVGHVFQGRFGSKAVEDDEQFWTAVRYIARNPVEAGLCRRAEEWRWSSHRATVEDAAPPWLDRARLLERFGTMGGEPARTYRQLIDG
jgi:REP element-mobilizing transposase RayT